MSKNPRPAPADCERLLLEMAHFIPSMQMRVLQKITRDETYNSHGRELDSELTALHASIMGAPFTFQQEGLSDDAIVHLHYFSPSANWYITGKDAGRSNDEVRGEQHRAFGLACITVAELGYINLWELCRHPSVNIDMFWKPKTVAECKLDWHWSQA